MEKSSSFNPNFIAPMPYAPPMYPNMENQLQSQSQTQPPPQMLPQPQHHQLLPPVVFHNGPPPPQSESRPTSVFILNGKPPMGPEPVKAMCPHCQQPMTSKVIAKVSLKTHFAALICCVLGLFCLAPIPYCMNAFKNLHHYCNNCGQYLGLYTAK